MYICEYNNYSYMYNIIHITIVFSHCVCSYMGRNETVKVISVSLILIISNFFCTHFHDYNYIVFVTELRLGS